MDFGRVVTAMVTPMNEDGSVNYENAQKLADYLLDNGTDSLVVCGTTGESPTTTWDEKIGLFTAVKEVTKSHGAMMIAGTSSYDTAASVELTKKAAAAGADAILAVTPYYNKPPQDGLYAHFSNIAAAAGDLPMILYNVPSRTVANLEANTVVRLSKIDNIVAVKEASGNLEQTSQIRLNTEPDFMIYCGDDSLTLPMLSLGASGVISVASHLIGKTINEMVAAFEDGDNAKALELHLASYQVFRKLFICSNPMPLKYCLNRIGMNVGPCRLPLIDVNPEHAAILDAMLKDIGLL